MMMKPVRLGFRELDHYHHFVPPLWLDRQADRTRGQVELVNALLGPGGLRVRARLNPAVPPRWLRMLRGHRSLMFKQWRVLSLRSMLINGGSRWASLSGLPRPREAPPVLAVQRECPSRSRTPRTSSSTPRLGEKDPYQVSNQYRVPNQYQVIVLHQVFYLFRVYLPILLKFLFHRQYRLPSRRSRPPRPCRR